MVIMSGGIFKHSLTRSFDVTSREFFVVQLISKITFLTIFMQLMFEKELSHVVSFDYILFFNFVLSFLIITNGLEVRV